MVLPSGINSLSSLPLQSAGLTSGLSGIPGLGGGLAGGLGSGLTSGAGIQADSGGALDTLTQLGQIMSQVATLIQGLGLGLAGGSTPATTPQSPAATSLPTQQASATTPVTGAGGNQLAAQAQQKNTTTDPTQKQRLDTILGKVAQDPEGAILLQKALANGYTFEVGDPSKAGSKDENDKDSINGVTTDNKIVINPNAPEFDKTVVHELVHAATKGDGDSQTEEGLADVIGYRISSRVDGTAAPGSDQQIFNNKIQNYPELQKTNDILASLKSLGVMA